MDFRFTEEQTMLAETVRGLLADLCQPADLRRLMASADASDATRWSRIVELGLSSALVPESLGGLGLGPVDFVQVAQACGYACLPEPLVENAGVAVPFLAEFGDQAADVLPAILDGTATVSLKHPANMFADNADTADHIVLAEGDKVYLVDKADVLLEAQPSIDPFRRMSTMVVEPRKRRLLASGDRVRFALDAAFDRGALFAAAQMLGIAQRCIDLAVAYAKERQQFGKPIGSYQAVKHLLATAQVKVEFARPVLYAAAAQQPQADICSRARISQAKLACADVADLAARSSIQVHGAMGYSWEVDVHFFLKRGIALSEWWGGQKLHRARVAERVFGGRLGPEFTFAREADHA
jgi:alkylation response protein AidB-like acyl-CoA dehydrogenase